MLGIQYLPCGTQGRSRGPFSVTFDSSFSTEWGWNLPWECWRLSEPREMFFISCSLLEKTFFFFFFTWVCVCSAQSWKQRKEGKWDLREETGTAVGRKTSPDLRFWAWKLWEGQKKQINNFKKCRIHIHSPKIPNIVGETASNRALCYWENKNIGLSFPFLPSWSVCFTRRIEKKWIVVLNRGWKGIGFSWECGEVVDVSCLPVF